MSSTQTTNKYQTTIPLNASALNTMRLPLGALKSLIREHLDPQVRCLSDDDLDSVVKASIGSPQRAVHRTLLSLLRYGLRLEAHDFVVLIRRLLSLYEGDMLDLRTVVVDVPEPPTSIPTITMSALPDLVGVKTKSGKK
jgi:hypothetical protein